jgi:hypothetical protein
MSYSNTPGYLHSVSMAPYLGYPSEANTQSLVAVASQRLAQMATDSFTRAHGWRSNLRIDSHIRVLVTFYGCVLLKQRPGFLSSFDVSS